ncbi:hypothetical protein HAX54_002756, partial [Datura stramonium]|nr:hypothetical protein [Datura stramonium]
VVTQGHQFIYYLVCLAITMLYGPSRTIQSTPNLIDDRSQPLGYFVSFPYACKEHHRAIKTFHSLFQITPPPPPMSFLKLPSELSLMKSFGGFVRYTTLLILHLKNLSKRLRTSLHERNVRTPALILTVTLGFPDFPDNKGRGNFVYNRGDHVVRGLIIPSIKHILQGGAKSYNPMRSAKMFSDLSCNVTSKE